jgi:hypothetical protein
MPFDGLVGMLEEYGIANWVDIPRLNRPAGLTLLLLVLRFQSLLGRLFNFSSRASLKDSKEPVSDGVGVEVPLEAIPKIESEGRYLGSVS